MNIIQELVTLFSVPFMQRAFIGGILFAVTAPLIGQFLVAKGYSTIADGIGHIAIVGVLSALILQFQPLATSIIVTIIFSCAIEFLRSKRSVKPETAVVIVTVLSLAVTLIARSYFSVSRSLESLLFGSIVSLRSSQILFFALCSFCIVIILAIIYKKLIAIVFNQELAHISGISVQWYNYLLIIITSIVVVIGIDVVGGLLMSSLMIIPVAASQQFHMSFRKTHIVAICFSVISVLLGIVASWFLNTQTGAMIAATSVLMFVLASGVSYLIQRYGS